MCTIGCRRRASFASRALIQSAISRNVASLIVQPHQGDQPKHESVGRAAHLDGLSVTGWMEDTVKPAPEDFHDAVTMTHAGAQRPAWDRGHRRVLPERRLRGWLVEAECPTDAQEVEMRAGGVARLRIWRWTVGRRTGPA